MTAAVDDRLRSRIPDHEARGVDDGAPDMSELIESVERIRAYAADIITTGHDRAVLGDALAIRDEADRAITRLREGSGTGVRASVYIVEEAEGQIWLSAGGLQASARIDSPMGQALQRLDTELRALVSPSKVDEGEELSSSRDHARAAGSALEWRPIESAPRDGTWLLLAQPVDGGEFVIGSGRWDADFAIDGFVGEEGMSPFKYRAAWTDYTVRSWGYELYQELAPSHWMPLPAPPVQSGAQGEARSTGMNTTPEPTLRAEQEPDKGGI